MIITERAHIGNHYYKHTYSDEGYFIIQSETNIEYDEAYDLLSSNYTYTESSKKIVKNEEILHINNEEVIDEGI